MMGRENIELFHSSSRSTLLHQPDAEVIALTMSFERFKGPVEMLDHNSLLSRHRLEGFTVPLNVQHSGLPAFTLAKSQNYIFHTVILLNLSIHFSHL